MTTRAEAAEHRKLKVRALGDRPQQRSAGAFAGGTNLHIPAVRSSIQIERAAAGSKNPDTARFEGFASVTNQTYTMYDMFGEYEELVAGGAFEQTLAQADLDTPLVIDHVSSRRIARTGNALSPVELEEVLEGDTTGLRSVAPTLQLSDPDTAYIVPKLESRLIDEMSFRFTIEAGRWNEEFTQFTIQRVNIHRGDVSIVGYGANPHTVGAGLRAQEGPSAVAREMLRRSRFEDLRL